MRLTLNLHNSMSALLRYLQYYLKRVEHFQQKSGFYCPKLDEE